MVSTKALVILSCTITALVTLCSLWGILTPDFYWRESLNWQAQSVGQDLVDLIVVVPALIATSSLAALNKRAGLVLWGGVLLYLIYTFTIYCFAVHFNSLFLCYCLILGLSFYSFLYLLYALVKNKATIIVLNAAYIRLAGIYFIFVSVLFYLFWLSDVIPSVQSGVTPGNLHMSGLLTNPVHVIDLAIFLPGLFITGILILKRKTLGFLFAPVMLVFFILMDITIGALVVIMEQRGLEANLSVATAMGLLAVFSFIVLLGFLRKAKFNIE